MTKIFHVIDLHMGYLIEKMEFQLRKPDQFGSSDFNQIQCVRQRLSEYWYISFQKLAKENNRQGALMK